MRFHCEFYSKASDQNAFMQEFLGYPALLFSNNSTVKLLPAEIESLYFKIHPLKHDFFLIKEGDRVVLRSMICQTPHEGIVYFGLLDFEYHHPDVSLILGEFCTVCSSWAKTIGAQKVLGPINFSTWLPYRLFSHSTGEERFSFEPDRPLEYAQLLKEAGLKTNQVFSSCGYDQTEHLIAATKADYEKAISLGYRFEFLPSKLAERDLLDLHRLSVSIFSENYLATPIDFLTFKHLYAAHAAKDDHSHSLFILSPQGERIGFFFNFYERGYCVAKTVGVEKGHRGTGISNGSFYLALERAQDRGVSKMIAAMVKEGAQSESYGRKMRLLWTHLYEILELSL